MPFSIGREAIVAWHVWLRTANSDIVTSWVMSALLSRTDVVRSLVHVRKVPIGDLTDNFTALFSVLT